MNRQTIIHAQKYKRNIKSHIFLAKLWINTNINVVTNIVIHQSHNIIQSNIELNETLKKKNFLTAAERTYFWK